MDITYTYEDYQETEETCPMCEDKLMQLIKDSNRPDDIYGELRCFCCGFIERI